MKKTLAAVAVLGAFAGSAFAANVTLYGLVDLGVNYTHTNPAAKASTGTFSMGSGQNSGSRFGLKGTEELGNGMTVGFVLENGFKADTGSFETGDRLFHRESLLFVQGAFGELSMGRTGALDAGTGRYNQMGSNATAMGTGWDKVGVSTSVLRGTNSRMDNTVTYKSPKFAGIGLLAQYSFDTDVTADTAKYEKHGTEGDTNVNRYYALGVTGDFGALSSALVVSQTNYASPIRRADVKEDADALAVSARVSYDFGMIKPMLAVQYFDDGVTLTTAPDTPADDQKKGEEGYGVALGATAPVFGGTLKVTGGYADYEYVGTNTDANTWMVGVGYEYPLSKRTFLYTAAGYEQTTQEPANEAKKEARTYEVMCGMVHKF